MKKRDLSLVNVAFFLTPKQEVVYERPTSTMRQALERMEHHRYTAIPLLDGEGKYVGTLTEGDLLWKMKNTPELSFKDTSKIFLKDVPQHRINQTVTISTSIEDLIHLAATQNYVPVLDDQGFFIGIVKRSDILDYCYKQLFENKEGH